MLNKSITRRLFVLASLKLVLFLSIISRLFYLQIKENHYFSYLSTKNSTSNVPIIPKRGIIFDYFKIPIASNKLIWELLFIKSTLNKPINELIEGLTKIIPLNESNINQIKKQYKNSYTYEPILIKSDLSASEIAAIEAYNSLFPEVFISAAYNRTYLYPEQVAHITGYIGKSSNKNTNKNIPMWNVGKDGIELALDSILKGEVGFNKYEVNAKGKVIKKLSSTRSTTGYNITITIDLILQNFIYNLIKNLSAAAVVLDIETGEILSCISTPSFNPNQLTYGISSNDWHNLIHNPENPLNNKAIAGLYPPASTIKPFVALMALEKNIIDDKTKVECKGYIDIGNRRFHCWKHSGHGYLNISQALINSCDIFFYKLGVQLKQSDFNQLGEVLQIPNNLLTLLQNSTKGNLPFKDENLPLGELAIAAIGQGKWLTTPLHIANMGAILANNGVIKEIKLLKEMDYNNKIIYSKPNKIIGSLPFSAKHIFFIKNSLDKVIKDTSNNNWPITGKTGTAQVVRITQEQRLKGVTQSNIKKYREHAVFMGYVPSHNPKYSLSLLIEHVGFASIHAIPIVREITKCLYHRHPFYENAKQNLKDILNAN